MKKTDFVFVGLLIVVVVVAILSTKGTDTLDIEYPITLEGTVGLNQINYDEYKQMVAYEKPFIFIIERAGCGYCQMYMPIVEEVAKEKKIPVYYVDTETFTGDELQELQTQNRYLKKNTRWGTPTTLLMKGEYILDSLGGYVDKNGFLSFLDGKVADGE